MYLKGFFCIKCLAPVYTGQTNSRIRQPAHPSQPPTPLPPPLTFQEYNYFNFSKAVSHSCSTLSHRPSKSQFSAADSTWLNEASSTIPFIRKTVESIYHNLRKGKYFVKNGNWCLSMVQWPWTTVSPGVVQLCRHLMVLIYCHCPQRLDTCERDRLFVHAKYLH